MVEQLSHNYNDACREMHSLGLSHSAGEKLARLLLNGVRGTVKSIGKLACISPTRTWHR